ncbi:hypothetical protein [Bacillus infantis]|uniref:hypothetical protein n=1 Tax=Bacillus infantis TaxID=324767 RepID=UPI00209F993A|nr:hypothetical protein [Bacillus infantis]MCP1161350.1 hypothetical protein [Bacillus infantis]
MNLKLTKSLAIEFRASIDELKSLRLECKWLSRFPRGRCGDTSDLFGKYLADHGLISEYVYGFSDTQSHGWIEIEGLIIDLTADQFEGISEKMLITNNRHWHSKFGNQIRRQADFNAVMEFNDNRLYSLYKLITNNISNTSN